MLVRGYGGYAKGYGGSPPPVTKPADLCTDEYTDDYRYTEVWCTSEDIRPTLTEIDRTGESAREAYDSQLAGKPVEETIVATGARLRTLDEADRDN